MKTTEVIDYTYIGVDVSKDKLDLYRSISKKSETLTNEVESIEQFCKSLKKLKTPVMVVMEATGGYETILVRALAKQGVLPALEDERKTEQSCNRCLHAKAPNHPELSDQIKPMLANKMSVLS